MKYEPCALTPQQEKLWDETRTALLWQCPAFSHIFYTMLDNANSKHVALFTKGVPIAATDGRNLILNPETFFQYNLMERVFACAHEILHCILDHMGMIHKFARIGKVTYPDGKAIPFNMQVMNIALDLVINDTLIQSNVGKFNKDWCHDTKIATFKDTGLDTYRKIYEESNGGKGGGTGGTNAQGKGFDEHLQPGTSEGKDPVTAAASRNESEWQTQVAAAAQSARVQGKLPAALDRLLSEILAPQVDWREKIQALFARKLGSGSYDWRRPDRRLIVQDIYAPGRSGFGSEAVVVGIDTSGSVGPKELDMFLAEVSGILEEVKPKRLIMCWCDAALNRVDEADDATDLNHIRAKGAPGGGGTSFVPVFEYIAKEGIQPDALVYLTDGLGTFPDKAPNYPVIWGSIYKDAKYPWGDVVDIPKQAA